MQNQIDTLRQLNYELIKNLGLFRQRAGLSFGQRHTLYHINAHQGLSIQELAELLQVDHSTMSRKFKKLMQRLWKAYQDDAEQKAVDEKPCLQVGRQVLTSDGIHQPHHFPMVCKSLDEDRNRECPLQILRKYSKPWNGFVDNVFKFENRQKWKKEH